MDAALGNSPYAVTASDTFNNVYVGFPRTGVLNHSAGTFTITSSLNLGNNSGSSGTYNLNRGILNVGQVTSGAGTSTFNLNGGTLRASAGNATFFQGLTRS